MFWRIFLESAATIICLVLISWGIYWVLTRKKTDGQD